MEWSPHPPPTLSVTTCFRRTGTSRSQNCPSGSTFHRSPERGCIGEDVVRKMRLSFPPAPMLPTVVAVVPAAVRADLLVVGQRRLVLVAALSGKGREWGRDRDGETMSGAQDLRGSLADFAPAGKPMQKALGGSVLQADDLAGLNLRPGASNPAQGRPDKCQCLTSNATMTPKKSLLPRLAAGLEVAHHRPEAVGVVHLRHERHRL